MQQQKIEFRKERDFASVLGDSLKFIKQNFKSFFASIILIVGPFILVMAGGYAYMQTTLTSLSNISAANPFAIFNSTYFIIIGIMLFFGLLANILLSGVVYNYLCIYNQKPITDKVTVREVARRLWSNIGSLITSTLTFIFTFSVALAIFALICFGIVSVLGVGGGILVGLLIIAGFIIYIPVISYFIPASFFVLVRDGVFIFSAMRKVKNYLSGNFWWTWLIMVVALIGLGILQTVFTLPATIMALMSTFSKMKSASLADASSAPSLLLLFFYTLGSFLTYCTVSISHVISAFNFMSHEEMHEGKGTLSRIEEIK